MLPAVVVAERLLLSSPSDLQIEALAAGQDDSSYMTTEYYNYSGVITQRAGFIQGLAPNLHQSRSSPTPESHGWHMLARFARDLHVASMSCHASG